LNLHNAHDAALNLYPFHKPFGSESVGRAGLPWRDRWRIGERAWKVIDVDVSRFVGMNHYWSAYYGAPELAGLVAPFAAFADGEDDAPELGAARPTERRPANGRMLHGVDLPPESVRRR
jgi:hypothetical protein